MQIVGKVREGAKEDQRTLALPVPDIFDLLLFVGVVLVAVAAYQLNFWLMVAWFGLVIIRIAIMGARMTFK